MANLRYNLVRFEDEATLTVFFEGQARVANDSHPYWEEILKGVTVDDDPAVLDLFDLTEVVSDKFQRLSERVTAHSGRIFFDGDEIDNSLTRKVSEFLVQKLDDWKPLVAFMEKVFTNPEVHSREQLFDFLAHNAFSITSDGDIVGYKGLYSEGSYGYESKPAGWESHKYRSAHSGTDTVTVDGVANTGYVWQSDGSVVEMARSAVHHDPATGCSHGLHVSNYQYASGYGDVTMMVYVNPRDVVSVPTEHDWQKVRVCRYVNAGLVTGPAESALVVTEPEDALVEDAPYDVDPVDESDDLFDGPGVVEPVAPAEPTYHGFKVGQHVKIVKDKWSIASEPNLTILGPGGTGLMSVGDTVYVSAHQSDEDLEDYNVRVVTLGAKDDEYGFNSLWLAPDALVAVDEAPKNVEDFKVGDKVRLTGKSWHGSSGTFEDLDQRGVNVGDEGTVIEGPNYSSPVVSKNVYVDFGAGLTRFVAPESLEHSE